MKYLAVSLAVVLAGCSTVVPVKREFPEATKALLEQCPELQQITGDKVAITDLLKTVVHNYSLYYQCSNKVDGWKDWYEDQKKNFNSVK
jgi:uncharacterized protein YceK